MLVAAGADYMYYVFLVILYIPLICEHGPP